jgi:cytochrome c peroxidase
LSFRQSPIEVGKHFALDVATCAKDGKTAPESLRVDAQMPEHRHGMNYAPTVTATGPQRWRAEGLMFHMPGRWEFAFELRAKGSSDVLRSSFVLASSAVDFTDEEKRKILSHGPWPPKRRRDPSNRVSGRIEAVALGERLFFEPRLSGTGSVNCGTCHVPYRRFQDARARGFGLEDVDRNTPTVLNVRFNRWFGWDGANDSLWSQSIRPLLDPREMRSSAAIVASFLRNNEFFSRGYERAFGRSPPASNDEVLVDVGKALAAFQETLVSGRTPFDDFRDAVERDDLSAQQRYPADAKRGLKIFIGKGNCSICHFGAAFTNGEFADSGVSFFVRPGVVDPGRQGGIKKLLASEFNLLGRFNDEAPRDAGKSSAVSTRHVEAQHRNFGEFRVPGLREVAETAPYMHNGSLATLEDVVRFYSELDEERLHADGEKILRALHLSAQEIADLVSFLRSLSVAAPR